MIDFTERQKRESKLLSFDSLNITSFDIINYRCISYILLKPGITRFNDISVYAEIDLTIFNTI